MSRQCCKRLSLGVIGHRERSVAPTIAYTPHAYEADRTVVVTNKDSSEHTATADTPGGFDSGALQPGQAAHIKLSQVGTFAYHCSFHAFMRGVIKVVR